MRIIRVSLTAGAAFCLVTSAYAATLNIDLGRRAYLRCEADATLPFTVKGDRSAALTNAVVSVRQFVGSELVAMASVPVPDLAADGLAKLAAPVETRLRPGRSVVSLALKSRDGKRLALHAATADIVIAPRQGDHMEIRLWHPHMDFEKFADIGFTGANGSRFMRWTGYERNLKPTEAERRKAFETFDTALELGMTYGVDQPFLYPLGKDPKRFYRLNRDGGVARDNIYKGPYPEVSNPEMQAFAREEAKFFIKEFSGHPAFKNVLFCSEKRDASFPSFNSEHKRFKAEKGFDVPEVIGTTNWNRLAWAKARFAATKGIVPEDDPVYVYEMWRLGGGDGWPAFLSAAYDEYHRAIKDPEFDTFWDPAVRWAPAWTSGGSCRTLGHWVYAVPEPMAVAGPAEETLAMARGHRPAQRVIPMTQLICYRRNLAPVQESVEQKPAWFRTHPDAAFLTVPPDALKEATWSMIAKPVAGVAYYGEPAVEETGEDWYACTAPASRAVLKDLCHNLLRPLGPTLKRLGRKPPRVAVLESVTSVIFGGHHQYGWSSEYVMHAQRARLDPRVIYEQEVVRDGLDGIDVIYAAHFVFTTQKVKDALDAFRKRGGILILDSDHLAAVEPDVVSPDAVVGVVPKIDQPEGIEEAAAASAGKAVTRLKTARTKNLKLKNAEILRERLAAKGYRPEVDSSSPEIIVYARQHGDIPYVFAVNDKRTFGDYVGQWGHMMEKGLPFEGEVTIRDPGFRNLAVYELSRGGRVDFTRKDGVVCVPVKYETTDGRLFVFAEQKIARVALEAKIQGEGEQRMDSRSLWVEMKVLGEDGRPMKGLWPVEVCVKDAAGNRIDGLGYGCAVDGVFTASVPLNLNDAKGAYTVTCRDRASGLGATTCAQEELRADREQTHVSSPF